MPILTPPALRVILFAHTFTFLFQFSPNQVKSIDDDSVRISKYNCDFIKIKQIKFCPGDKRFVILFHPYNILYIKRRFLLVGCRQIVI